MTRSEIEAWLKQNGIENYTIRSDLTVDINGSVQLRSRNLDVLPFQFGRILHHFCCAENRLVSLEGTPLEIGGNFICYKNNLENLKHSPKVIRGVFDTRWNPIKTFNNLDFEFIGSFRHRGDPIFELENFYTEVIEYNLYNTEMEVNIDFEQMKKVLLFRNLHNGLKHHKYLEKQAKI